MNQIQRKIINIFKSFIQRVFLPQISKMQLTCKEQWNKFNNMISNQQININQLQLYVDALPNLNSTPSRKGLVRPQNKSPLFPKGRKQSQQDMNLPFNPSKTFGGDKAKLMFSLKQYDDQTNDRLTYNFDKDQTKQKQDSFQTGLTTQTVLPTLEKLFKFFCENQSKLEKIGFNQLPPSTYQHRISYN